MVNKSIYAVFKKLSPGSFFWVTIKDRAGRLIFNKIKLKINKIRQMKFLYRTVKVSYPEGVDSIRITNVVSGGTL